MDLYNDVAKGFRHPTGPLVNPERETVYIAGPISGDLVGNMPAFYDLEAELNFHGHSTFNPGRLDGGETARDAVEIAMRNKAVRSWDWYMRRCVVALASCTALILLPGWDKSEGACTERNLAVRLGIPIWLASDEYRNPETASIYDRLEAV